jgi:hypothetical protein
MKIIKIKKPSDIPMLFHLVDTLATSRRIDERGVNESGNILRVSSSKYSIHDAIELIAKNNPYFSIKEEKQGEWTFVLHNIKSSEIGEIFVSLKLAEEHMEEIQENFEIEIYEI